MGLMTAYLMTAKNAEAFFNALQTAKAPERFTLKFLKDLDFTSSNDRLYIGVLKGLGFIDENGVPSPRYFAFLDHSQSRRVLADAIRDAYSDLFALNKTAEKLDADAVKGKFKSLTQGQKSENVIKLMAMTFRTLCDLGDWSAPPAETSAERIAPALATANTESGRAETTSLGAQTPPIGLHYNIQLILPDSRDQAVYDALFASLRRHLF